MILHAAGMTSKYYGVRVLLCLMMILVSHSWMLKTSLKLRISTIRMNSADREETMRTLDVNDIAGRYKVIQYGQGGEVGSFELSNQDNKYATELVRIQVSRVGGLGLDLAEYVALKGKGGIVLVNEVVPGSNADNTGLFQPGDALVSVKAAAEDDVESVYVGADVPKGIVRVEGLNFDATIDELDRFRDCPTLIMTV
jgi:hypothetical protein